MEWQLKLHKQTPDLAVTWKGGWGQRPRDPAGRLVSCLGERRCCVHLEVVTQMARSQRTWGRVLEAASAGLPRPLRTHPTHMAEAGPTPTFLA